MALLVQKFCGEFFLSEFVSCYFKTKKHTQKSSFSTKREGGGGKAGPLKKIFLRLPLCKAVRGP